MIKSKHPKVLKTEEEYKTALARTIEIFHAEPDSPDFKQLELLLGLIKDYEDRYIEIPEPDPVARES